MTTAQQNTRSTNYLLSLRRAASFALFTTALAPAAAVAAEWPDLAKPADQVVGGGEDDAAVIVAIEGYPNVAKIPGAKDNANAWFDYLVRTRKVPAPNVALLLDAKATKEDIAEQAEQLAARAGKRGTLWFVFIGHGAPARDGKDGLLVGYDAQQRANSLAARSIPQKELLAILEKSPASRIQVVIDACFSGRTAEGKPLVDGLQPMVITSLRPSTDKRTVILTAAKSG